MGNQVDPLKFHCFITDAPEDYDSGVWEFFRHMMYIESDLGMLIHVDVEWCDNYRKLLQYVSDVGSSIILKRDSPSSEFLKEFLTEKHEDEDESDILLRSKDAVPALLIRTGAEIEELMAMYVRLSKIPRFSASFSKERFDGLRQVSWVLFRRSIKLSKL